MAAAAGATGVSRPLSFLQGALFQWVNPEAWMVALGTVAACTTATGAAYLARPLLLAFLVSLATLPPVAFWTPVGVGAAKALRTRRSVRSFFDLALATLIAASLLPLLSRR